MGRGDRKTKKGKIRLGSFGKVRPRKKATETFVAKESKPKKVENLVEEATEKKKTTAKKTTKKKATAKKKTTKKKD